MDALSELEDEHRLEAGRRMIYCDAENNALVLAHIHVAMPDGLELKLCNHHADIARPKLTELGAFLYQLSALKGER